MSDKSPEGGAASSTASPAEPSVPNAHRWEALCLADDPFDGDYGGSGDSDGVLSDKMVTNRKGGTCSTCGEPCAPGTRNRVRSEVYDGEFMRFRWCVKCSFGMAVYDIRPSILDSRIASAIEARSDATGTGAAEGESAASEAGDAR